MNLNDWRLVFIFFSSLLILSAGAPIIETYLPSRSAPFIASAILGDENLESEYYPSNNTLQVGEKVSWNIFVYNHMHKSQYISVKVKLINSTISSPNSTECAYSPAPVIYEVKRIISHNETWLHNFIWSIKEANDDGDFFEIHLLEINNIIHTVKAQAHGGNNFRFIFELWVYDENYNDFKFKWENEDKFNCIWNHIWFNVII